MTAILGEVHFRRWRISSLLFDADPLITGGCATIIASFLARARGSHEPEFSIARVKDLEQYIRDCETFTMDYGHLLGSANPEQNKRLEELRERLEELLGNNTG